MSIAYQVVGGGDVDVVFVPSFVSHLDLLWTVPECANWLEQVSSFARLVIFDKLGTGLSDPVPSVRTIDDRVREIEAVISHSGLENPALFGMSEGAPSAIMYAATHPASVRSLVLFGSFGRFGMPSIFDRDAIASPAARAVEAEAIRGSMLEDGWIDEQVPTTDQIERLLRWQEAAFVHWGEGRCLRELLPNTPSPTSALAIFERSSASPGMARATLSAALAIDITSVLPTISVPALVIHARDDLVPVQFGRYVAEKIPDAHFLELDSADHAPWIGEPELVLEQLELFLTGTHRHPPPTRVLATVLFTDIVGSTEIAHRLGDTHWRQLLERFDRRVREVTERHDGQLVKAMGDGHLTTYSAPTNALRAATELHGEAAELGIELRAGAHTGEVEIMGDDIGGLAVHIAARIGAAADAGEILVSRTVRDLVIGSGTRFENRGPQVLKGVPEPWELMAVIDDDPAGAADPEVLLARVATPPARTSMTRTDRIIGHVARRAPGLIRSGISRLG